MMQSLKSRDREGCKRLLACKKRLDLRAIGEDNLVVCTGKMMVLHRQKP